ncbi:hypothetical protein V6N13_138297 [Hibiscus sabdariffa]|uniref:Uncharacterized protein n=1 Tax=Hibiscus sabdariffa TaxID=183260 RepID=A0ABR2QD45_9ROSI
MYRSLQSWLRRSSATEVVHARRFPTKSWHVMRGNQRSRQHWFISRLDGASVTAGSFPPQDRNVLIITTSSNQFYIFDVEARQLREWWMRHSFTLPRRYQEFPGEVIGLSFCPSSSKSSSVVV